jgi:trehalose synthase
MQRVEIAPTSIEQLTTVLTPERAGQLRAVADRARDLMAGRTVWNVNATAHGGGVAEMLETLLAYGRGAGIDCRWLVLDGEPDFFRITKRVHNLLHGDDGDGGVLGEREHADYQRVMDTNLATLRQLVRAQDVVLLHDPQTAGLVDGVRTIGAKVIWRCHIGADAPNRNTEHGWHFVQRYLHNADAFIFSRKSYAPAWVNPARLSVIAPSIDPLSEKNRTITPAQVAKILCRAGLLAGTDSSDPLPFNARDGKRLFIRQHREVIVDGPPPPPSARLVVQVSRWDRLKDMAGVLLGFAAHSLPDDVHLMLVGPDVAGVADDPEGAEVLADCRARWRELPASVRVRVHLACLPMADPGENALIVNAVQRHACVIVQKSLVEGFGLTVTEALWKGRPVIASSVGGIRDQIIDGRDGLLLPNPRDLDAFASALQGLLEDPPTAARLGAAGQLRVRTEFLGDRHLTQYFHLFAELIK